MASNKGKIWKIPLIGALIFGPFLAWLTFGERGLIHLYRTEKERQAYVERIHRLVDENEALLEEVKRLRSDMNYVESVARRELNLVRDNEVVYRFDPDKPVQGDPESGKEEAQQEERRHERTP